MPKLNQIQPSIGALTAKDALEVIAMLAKIRLQNLEIAAKNAEIEAETARAQGEVAGNLAKQDADAQLANSSAKIAAGGMGVGGGMAGAGLSKSSSSKIKESTAEAKHLKDNWVKHFDEIESSANKSSVSAGPQAKAVTLEAQQQQTARANALENANVLKSTGATHRQALEEAYANRGTGGYKAIKDKVHSTLEKSNESTSRAENQRATQMSTVLNLFTAIGSAAEGAGGTAASQSILVKQQLELLKSITDYSSATFRAISQAINQLSEGELNQILSAAQTLMGEVAAANKV